MQYSQAESQGTLEMGLAYSNGDRINTTTAEIYIYKINEKLPIAVLSKQDSWPSYKTELTLNQNYRVETFLNGVSSSIQFVNFKSQNQYVDIIIPLSHGIEFQVFYNDGYTPIPEAKVILYINDKKISNGLTDIKGTTTRFWVPSNNLDDGFYQPEVKFGNTLSYQDVGLKLNPGEKSTKKIVTPWPKMVDYVELTIANDKNSKTQLDEKNTIVKLIGEKETLSSKINRGTSKFTNLSVGNFQVVLIDTNNSDQRVLANQTITITEKANHKQILLKEHGSQDQISENRKTEKHFSRDATEYFQKNHMWIKESKSGIQLDDVNDYVIGIQSFNLTTEGNGLPTFSRSPLITTPLDLENKHMVVWLKISHPSEVKELWFTLTSDNFETGWLTFDYKPFLEKIRPNQWTQVILDPTDFKETGNQKLSAINRIQIRITDNETIPVSLKINEVSFRKIISNNELDKFGTCNCVAFRLDDIQDYWLNDVQLEIMKTFVREDTPLTIGIIGNHFGKDVKVVDYIRKNIKNSKLEVANHGWEHESFLDKDPNTQRQLIEKTNDKLFKIFHLRPTVFIPPFNSFNDDTINAAKASGITHISSEFDKSFPPYPLSGKIIYDFPQGAITGDLDRNGINFIGINHVVTLTQIKNSIKNHGFAVVTIHPQEFSNIEEGQHVNKINQVQIKELEFLISEIKKSGINVTPISEINSKIEFQSHIPGWFKKNAIWWINNELTDIDFIKSLEFLLKKDIISIHLMQDSKEKYDDIPNWVRININWWANDLVSDKEFESAVRHLAENGIINI